MGGVPGYLLRRTAGAVGTLFGVSVLVFFLMRSLPGDAALIILGGAEAGNLREADLEVVRERLGMNQPLLVQYWNWLQNVVRLDFGVSTRTGSPVMQDILRRLPNTLSIVLLSSAIAMVVGVILGVLSAAYYRTRLDDALRLGSMVGLAAPSFWVGLLVIILLVNFFSWSPPLRWVPIWQDPRTAISQFIFPAITVGLFQTALVTRITRSSMLDVLSQDYIRAVRSKGVGLFRLWFKHGLRNAILPVLTLAGVEFATLVGGLIVTERVWNVPGVSSYVVTSVLERDYAAMQGVVLLIAFVVVLVNLAVDLSYRVLNPRLRVSAGG
jgi:peptide/nickel transport system permease protein